MDWQCSVPGHLQAQWWPTLSHVCQTILALLIHHRMHTTSPEPWGMGLWYMVHCHWILKIHMIDWLMYDTHLGLECCMERGIGMVFSDRSSICQSVIYTLEVLGHFTHIDALLDYHSAASWSFSGKWFVGIYKSHSLKTKPQNVVTINKTYFILIWLEC